MNDSTEVIPLTLEQKSQQQVLDYINKWKRITWGILLWSVLYHIAEGGVSIYYGFFIDDAIALAAFGIDSGIEVFSTVIVLYHMAVYELTVSNSSNHSQTTNKGATHNTNNTANKSVLLTLDQERIGTILIGILLFLFGIGATCVGILRIIYQSVPQSEFASMVISGIVLVVMLVFWVIKTEAAVILNSSVLTSDANCSLSCIKVTVVLLLGSVIYTITNKLWWLDSAMVIAIGVLVAKEGYDTVKGAWDRETFGGGCGCCDGSDTMLAKWLRKSLSGKFKELGGSGSGSSSGNRINYVGVSTDGGKSSACEDACCKDKNGRNSVKNSHSTQNNNNSNNNSVKRATKFSKIIGKSKKKKQCGGGGECCDNDELRALKDGSDGSWSSCKKGCCEDIKNNRMTNGATFVAINVTNDNNNNNNNESIGILQESRDNNKNDGCSKGCCSNKNKSKSKNNNAARVNNIENNTFISIVNGSSVGSITNNTGHTARNTENDGLFEEISDENEWNEILKEQSSNVPLFVLFTADWSNECEKIYGVLVSLVKEHSNKYKYIQVNVDEGEDIAISCNVGVELPVIQVYNNSNMIRNVANPDLDTLQKLFE